MSIFERLTSEQVYSLCKERLVQDDTSVICYLFGGYEEVSKRYEDFRDEEDKGYVLALRYAIEKELSHNGFC